MLVVPYLDNSLVFPANEQYRYSDRMLSILAARQQFDNSNGFTDDPNDDVPFWWTHVRDPEHQYCTAANTTIERSNHKMGDLLRPPSHGLRLLVFRVYARKAAG